jgi:hypothetical protein
MDTVGVVASVAQLAELTAKILGGLYRYYDNVKSAQIRSSELRNELTSLLGLLTLLEQSLHDEVEDISPMVAALQDLIGPLHDVIHELAGRVQTEKTEGWRKLKWPFDKDENQHFIARITRYKENLILALNMEERYVHWTSWFGQAYW